MELELDRCWDQHPCSSAFNLKYIHFMICLHYNNIDNVDSLNAMSLNAQDVAESKACHNKVESVKALGMLRR